MVKFAIEKVESIVEEEKNADVQHFLLFQRCLEKTLSQGPENLGYMFQFPHLPPEVFSQRVQAVLRQVLTQRIMHQSDLQRRQVIIEFLLLLPNFFNPFPNKPWFLCVCNASLLKTLREKEKLLVTSNFSFSHSVFYPFGELFAIFVKFNFVVCNPFLFGRV